MGFCVKHKDVECRFFCNTCGIPVCHTCMEKGDHVISKHDCIPVTKYCETIMSEIHTVLEEATKHKIRYDELILKWDMHLSSIEEEYDQLKNEIQLTKQRLLQLLDFDEQLQLQAAGIEMNKLERAIKSVQWTHEQTFSGVYQQLNGKLQFLIRTPFTQNSKDNEAVIEECHKLLNNLRTVLSKFEMEDMLGINVTFVPLNECSLGEVMVPKDARCLTGSALASSNLKVSTEPTRKRKLKSSDTTTVLSIKKEKIERSEGGDDPAISYISKASTSNTYTKSLSQDGTSETALAVKATLSNQDGSISSAMNTNFTHSNTNGRTMSDEQTYAQQANGDNTAFKSCMHLHLSTDSHRQLPGSSKSLQANSNTVSVNNGTVHNSQQHITVETSCSGIIWANTDWLFEVTTTKACLKVKHHKLSDSSILRSDTIIYCNQTLKDKKIRVCPKICSQNCSFVLAFKDQIAIISLQGMKLGDVSWRQIPNTFTILAIAWRKDPSKYIVIARGPDGTVNLMRDVSESSASPQFEKIVLSDISLGDLYHPLDISPNDEFAVCNTSTGRILFFSKLGESIPTREVLAPFHLNDGKPVSISFIDDKRKWLALWKGNSASDGLPKWVIELYTSKLVPVSTMVECSYRNLHEEPKAFCVRGNKIAVLFHSLRIGVHTIKPTPPFVRR